MHPMACMYAASFVHLVLFFPSGHQLSYPVSFHFYALSFQCVILYVHFTSLGIIVTEIAFFFLVFWEGDTLYVVAIGQVVRVSSLLPGGTRIFSLSTFYYNISLFKLLPQDKISELKMIDIFTSCLIIKNYIGFTSYQQSFPQDSLSVWFWLSWNLFCRPV